MGLMSLDDVKDSLRITSSVDDDFIEEQIEVVSEAIEIYCRRKFEQKTYTETFYASDYRYRRGPIELFVYPVKQINSVISGGTNLGDYRLHPESGHVFREYGFFFGEDLVIEYIAGYEKIPALIKSVLVSVVGERYAKKSAGVALSFGSDVQRVSIPGTISIDFDYSLMNNDRVVTMGTILGSHVNVLDYFRSNRAVVPTGKLSYVTSV